MLHLCILHYIYICHVHIFFFCSLVPAFMLFFLSSKEYKSIYFLLLLVRDKSMNLHMFSFPCRCTYAIFCYMSHTLIFYKLLNMNFILLLWKSKTEDFTLYIFSMFFFLCFMFSTIFNM